MQDLLQLAQDIAQGCHYLEENHFIHRLETILTLETLGPLVPSEHPSLYTTFEEVNQNKPEHRCAGMII